MPFKAFTAEPIGTVTIYKRKRSRSIRLTVTPEGAVRVTIPYWTPYQAGLAFAVSKQAWIQSQSLQVTTRPLRSGDRVGKQHILVFEPGITASNTRSSTRQHTIYVRYSNRLLPTSPAIQQVAKKACLRILKQETALLLEPRLQQLATFHGFQYKGFAVKQMKSRWGSCDHNGNIILNSYLIQLPWPYIDYVMLHELTHTKVLNHGPQFWTTLEGVLPEARKLRRAMRVYRPTLLVGQTFSGMA